MLHFEQAAENIYYIKTPFSIVWSGVVLIIGEKNFLVDSGADEPEKYLIPALRGMGMELGDIDYLLNTHCHGDHIGGHHTLVTKYGLKVATFAGGSRQMENPAENAVRIRTRFPEHSPAPQSWLKGVKPHVVLEDGDILENRLKVISTPGHDMDCVCWYDIPTKTIICGDSLQANGTPTQGIGFYQDLGAYRNSLKRLQGEDIENILCGHNYDGIGDLICGKENVKKAFDYCMERTETYGNLLWQYYEEGEHDSVNLAKRLINEVGCGMPAQLFLPLYTVTEHLKEIKI